MLLEHKEYIGSFNLRLLWHYIVAVQWRRGSCPYTQVIRCNLPRQITIRGSQIISQNKISSLTDGRFNELDVLPKLCCCKWKAASRRSRQNLIREVLCRGVMWRSRSRSSFGGVQTVRDYMSESHRLTMQSNTMTWPPSEKQRCRPIISILLHQQTGYIVLPA
jgi:hypothetical protein